MPLPVTRARRAARARRYRDRPSRYRRPVERIGRAAVDAAGFQFREELTAARQIERLGFRPADVTDIVLTHADSDHAGGLADFSRARVHLSAEEFAHLSGGDPRYSAAQFAHAPRWVPHAGPGQSWFGLDSRALPLGAFGEVFLVPLLGHTKGHCGVAVRTEAGWLLHTGDAYHLRAELATEDHPVSALAQLRADDDLARRASLAHLRRLARDITLFGSPDFGEFPPR